MTSEYRRGFAAALGAYLLWAIFPLYFTAVASVGTVEVVANRVLWSAVLATGAVLLRGRGGALVAILRSRRLFWGLIGSTVFITVNWGIYVWAVIHGHAIDGGFGYLLNPLVTTALGVLVLRERLGAMRWAAVGLAVLGVGALAWGRGGVPWVAIALPISFGVYGLLRKVLAVDSLVGLAFETLVLAPFALVYLATRPNGGALLGQGWGMAGLMLLAGPITAAPLALFSYGARRLPLATMGQLQYLSPSIQLLLATFVLGETFTKGHAVAFGLIWAGIAVYALAPKPIDKAPSGGQISPERAAPAAPEPADF